MSRSRAVRCVVARVALVLALLPLLAACSLGSDDDFAETVQASRNDVDRALQQVTEATTFDDLLERLRSSSRTIAVAADRVAETDPPDDLRDERDELEQSYRALADEVDATAVALEDVTNEDSPPIEGINFRNWDRVQRALTALREEGIEVRPLGRH
jgi:hypothetical protein